MRVFACFLIGIGVLVMLYPSLNNVYGDYQQKRLLQAYEYESIDLTYEEKVHSPDQAEKLRDENVSDGQATASYRELNRLFALFEADEDGDEHEEEDESTNEVSAATPTQLVGTLQVRAIELTLPILDGATEKNLRYAAGHLEGTAGPGAEGNMAIAAHRSFKFGRLFNRLDDLEFGDEIVIVTEDAVYSYEVREKMLVEPSDVSVLQVVEGEAIVTLITCHPMNNPTHRLIVQAYAKL